MSTYKLYYFNITGLGEPVRYMLNYGGVKFEDIRLNFDDWPKKKSGKIKIILPQFEIFVFKLNNFVYETS